MRGILYFSSTGNSLYLAKRIREKLPGRILYLPDYTGDGSEFEEIVLVSPVYSYGLPVHTYDFFLRMTPAARVTVVLSYGGMTGGAERLVCEFARQYGKRLQAVYTVAMPENYTLTFSTPGFYNRLVLRRAEKKIDCLIASMQRGEVHLPAAGKTRRALYEKEQGKLAPDRAGLFGNGSLRAVREMRKALPRAEYLAGKRKNLLRRPVRRLPRLLPPLPAEGHRV